MENRETELLESIQSRLTAMEAQEKKRSRRSIILAAVSVILVLGLVIFLWINVSAFLSEVRPVVDAFEAVDMEAVAAKVNELAAMDTAGLENLADYLAGMDEAELKTRLDSMNETLDVIAKLDVESLNKALTDMAKSLEPLMKLFGGRS